jgi:hypothetical protein
MQLRRGFPVIGALAMAVAIACSDSGSTAPEGPRTSVATTGQTDTSKTSPTNPTTPPAPKPDSGKGNPTSPTNPTTPPDSGGARPTPSTDPLPYVGTVMGMGPVGDTANVQKVAGATVVLSLPADTSAGTPEKEIARATSGADGTFSLGTFKLGRYALTVTPPAGSPYKSVHWNIITGSYGGKVDLMVWLPRK